MNIMKDFLLVFSLFFMFLSHGLCSQPDILYLPFDEQTDHIGDNQNGRHISACLNNVRWALGSFGKALYFSGTNSFVDIPSPPGLDGAEAFSLSIWVLWKDGALRSYPNILTSHTWSPGGMMIFVNNGSCSFRMGRPDVKGEGWQETSVLLLSEIPKGRWTHLCVTFNKPVVTSYVNGKKVASVQWNYPLQCDDIRLGGWNSQITHHGLIDDFRIYTHSLSTSEIMDLASDKTRELASFEVHESIPLPLVKTIETEGVRFGIDEAGRISELYSKSLKRSLISGPSSCVGVELATGLKIQAFLAEVLKGDILRFYFPGIDGNVDLKFDERDGIIEASVEQCSVPGVSKLTFFEINSALKKYCGQMANMFSDDEAAVCLRAYNLPVEMSVSNGRLSLQISGSYGLTGFAGGLASGTRSEVAGLLKKMTMHAGVPYSMNGGAWSLESNNCRGSYLFANLSYDAVDDWIELARRCGYDTIHLHAWWERLGHYPVNRNFYPEGEADMKRAVERIHSAGLRAGMHTLTACIHPLDPWVTPKPHPDLLCSAKYSLAQELGPDNKEIFVNEIPIESHDVVFTYSGNGNALRIDDEIIKYSRVSREKPYAFLECERGAFGTKPASHIPGTDLGYLQQRYYAFYPRPDSALAEELASRLAHIFNSCNIDSFYFDGSEGMRSRYGIDFMRHCIMNKLDKRALIEASCHGAHNWWFHSRLGAWDHPVWGMKSFHDKHIAIAREYRKSDMLATQLGWWAPRSYSNIARGHYLEEMEYFACKNMAMNTASSIQGVDVTRSPLPLYIEQQMTVLGWYENLRMADYFDEHTLERISAPGEDFELRLAEDGSWKFVPIIYQVHRVGSGFNSFWSENNPFGEQSVCMRLSALQKGVEYNDSKAVRLLGGGNIDDMNLRSASPSITLKLECDDKDGAFHDVLRLHSENKGASSDGAWVAASRDFSGPGYFDISGCGAVGVWVKGDGSGALLNVQLESPREYLAALSEHYIKLDFSGWRYFELHFRERDTEQFCNYRWPYSNTHALYRNRLDTKHLSKVNIYLNSIPSGGSVDISLSPIVALPVTDAEVVNPVVSLNGKEITLPVSLVSGEFVELDERGGVVHYNRYGEPVKKSSVADLPELICGTNELCFKGGNSPRVEIAVIARGKPFGMMNDKRLIINEYLKRFYEMPAFIMTDDVFEKNIFTVGGKAAAVEIELYGPINKPVLSINSQESEFAVDIKRGERLICRDGYNWKVIDEKRNIIVSGALKQKLDLLQSGGNLVRLEHDGACAARLNIVKVAVE